MMSLSYEEMLDLTEEKLEKMGVTKVRYCLAKSDCKSIVINLLSTDDCQRIAYFKISKREVCPSVSLFSE